MTGSLRPEGGAPGMFGTDSADDLDVPIVFRRQARAVEARHRTIYRSALLILVLSRFNKDAARLDNLHLFVWATRSSRTRNMLRAWWSGKRFISTTSVRLDPDLDLSIRLARADRLVETAGTNRQRLRLTEKGQAFARLLDETANVLSEEKKFLDSFQALSDGSVDRKLGRDRL